MEARKFTIGERVRLRLNDAPADIFTVSRVLPEAAKVWQYRVKRIGDGQERAVSEPQLAKAAALEGTPIPAAPDPEPERQRIRSPRPGARVRMTQ